VVNRPLVAVTGRRLGAQRTTWPYAHAPALPRAYLDALRRAGAHPAILDPEPIDARAAGALLARFDALVLTGGPDVDPACYGDQPHAATYGVDREADEFEVALVRAALDREMRTLAICRGAQVCNVAFGGALHQHLTEEPGVDPHGVPGEAGGQRLHEIDVTDDSLLRQVVGTARPRCSCHHHQAIAAIGDGLRVTARATDGIVEALELDGAPLLAVQWHPEDTAATDPAQQRLFAWLVGS
jgi:putative glutamine amidotransferase